MGDKIRSVGALAIARLDHRLVDWLTVRIGPVGLVLFATAAGFGVLASAILSTPYVADDSINQFIRREAAATGQSLGDLIVSYTTQWMTSVGRFFPGSLSWSFTLFWVTGSRVEYKLVLIVVLIAAIALAAALAWLVTRNRSVAAMVPLAIIATLQIRVWFDGLISFAGLLPLTLALTLASCVILLSRRGPVVGIAAALCYFLALITYETVILFAPAMVFLVFRASRSWRQCLPLVVPPLIVGAIAVVLRSQASSVGAYSVSLDPHTVAATYTKQVLAAVPFSQWWLGFDAAPIPRVLLVAACLVAIGAPVFVAARVLATRSVVFRPRSPSLLVGFGAWIWLSSSVLIAVTARWQVEMPLGQGYLSVVYGYFGFAFISAGLWLAANASIMGNAARSAWLRIVWLNGSAGLLAIVSALTAACNLTATVLT